MFDEEPLKNKQENAAKIKKVLEVIKRFDNNKQFWSTVHNNLKDFKYKQFDFLFDFTYEFKDLMKATRDPPSF